MDGAAAAIISDQERSKWTYPGAVDHADDDNVEQ
jgi:hypothetical protein